MNAVRIQNAVQLLLIVCVLRKKLTRKPSRLFLSALLIRIPLYLVTFHQLQVLPRETAATPHSICSCAQGYYSANSNTSCNCLFSYKDQCLPVKIDSTTCTTNTLCVTYVPNSECFTDICTCKAGYSAVEGGSVCEERALGAPCQNDSDCSDKLSNTGCFNNICDCVSGYTANANQSGCIASECFTTWFLNFCVVLCLDSFYQLDDIFLLSQFPTSASYPLIVAFSLHNLL